VGIRDALFGKKKLADPASERLFALTTAAVTLETELGLKTAGSGGVCFKAQSSGEFVRVENELTQLVEAVAQSSGSKIERSEDEYGFTWVVARDPDLEDLVGAVHTVSSELEAQGFGPQLLAAVFPFERTYGEGRRVFWVYGYKRGAFWPFVPTGEGQNRDNATELELKAKLEGELPIEPDLSRWFGPYGAPV
jgi:hypothetical protein